MLELLNNPKLKIFHESFLSVQDILLVNSLKLRDFLVPHNFKLLPFLQDLFEPIFLMKSLLSEPNLPVIFL